jgi:hypothetical protein
MYWGLQMVKVFTSRLTDKDKEADPNGDRINTTTQTGKGRGAVLAPTWSLVMGYKLHEALQKGDADEIARWKFDKYAHQPNTPLDADQYTTKYLGLLRERYATDKRPFLDLLHSDKVVLACYCAPGSFCHRHIATDVLQKVATVHNMPFERGGEIDPYTGRLWLAPGDPSRQTVQIGVVSVLSPQDKQHVGYATAALISQNSNRHLMEMAHFAPGERDRAEQYTDDIIKDMGRARLITSGGADEVQATAQWLVGVTRDYGLPGLWQPFSLTQNEAWDRGERIVLREPDRMRIRVDPERNEIRFGVFPLVAQDGSARYGYSAAATIQQGHTCALLELAHFPNNGEKRAHQFVDGIEHTLEKSGYKLEGATKWIEKTVQRLTEQAQQNHQSGEWRALHTDDLQRLQMGKFQIEHEHSQVRTLSSGRGAEWAEID